MMETEGTGEMKDEGRIDVKERGQLYSRGQPLSVRPPISLVAICRKLRSKCIFSGRKSPVSADPGHLLFQGEMARIK